MKKIESMKFRGIYFTIGGVDEPLKPILFKWGWRVSQTRTALFLGFCYLSWVWTNDVKVKFRLRLKKWFLSQFRLWLRFCGKSRGEERRNERILSEKER